jgi:tyrosine-protein phosphatase
VEPERQEINTKTFTLPAFPYKADGSATPTEALTSPRSTEFAMAPLNPSADVESADAFGLMSPTSTEFASSPFDRSALLAQLGMGSMQHHDQVPLRTRSNNPQSKPRSLATPSGKMLRGKVSSPSIREQQELQRLQADIEKKLHIEQQQNHQHQHHHQPLMPQPTGAAHPMLGGFGDALMSPRATEFTENPFAVALAPSAAITITEEQKPTALDPRSPAHKGVSPITRNIGDVL